MAATNLLFTALAWSGKSELMFAIAVIFDDIAAAFATVAFVAFISLLVDRTYTRGPREASRGKLSGRTQEIQRLIGRSLRTVIDRQ